MSSISNATLLAGETLNLRTADGDLPAYAPSSGWSLQLIMNPRAGGANITVNLTPDGNAYLLQASKETTASWPPGVYAYAVVASNVSGEAYEIERGQLQIVQSLRIAPAGIDTRTDAEKALAAIQATLSGKADSAVQSYQINGRQLSSYPLDQLLLLEQRYIRAVAEERRAAGLQDGRGSVRRIAVRLR